MHEAFQQVIAILYGIWRRKWYAMAVAFAICSIGWIYVATVPNTYKSEARIYVDTDSVLPRLMEGLAARVDIYQQLQILRQTLVSRNNLETVARRTDMDLQVKGSGDSKEYDTLIENIRSNVALRSEGSNLYWLEYESGDPELSDAENADLAKRVVQQLLNIFQESHLGTSREDIQRTRIFIDDQIAEYERQLEEAERRKAEFERRNFGLISSNSTYASRIEEAEGRLGATLSQLEEAEAVRDRLTQELRSMTPFIQVSRGGSTFTSGGSASSGSSLDLRIANLEREVDALKLRGYTDKHPDVIYAQRQIDSLKDERQKEQEQIQAAINASKEDPNTAPTQGVMPNPLYEETKLRQIEADSQVERLRKRRDTQTAALTELRDQVNRIPALEAEFAKLNRDYSVIKSNYDQLVERREQARLTQDLEAKSDNVQFRIVDPPTTPLKPATPNRPMLLTMVLGIGIAGGLAVAFVLSQIQPTFLTMETLQNTFGLPVLGAISMVETAKQRRQRFLELSLYGGLGSVLVATYLVLLLQEFLQTSV